MANGYLKDPRVLYCPATSSQDWQSYDNYSTMWSLLLAGGTVPVTNPANTAQTWNWQNPVANYLFWAACTKWSAATDPYHAAYMTWAQQATDPGARMMVVDAMVMPYNGGGDWGRNHKVSRNNVTTSDGNLVGYEGGNELMNDGSVAWHDASETKLQGEWDGWTPNLFW